MNLPELACPNGRGHQLDAIIGVKEQAYCHECQKTVRLVPNNINEDVFEFPCEDCGCWHLNTAKCDPKNVEDMRRSNEEQEKYNRAEEEER